MQFDITGLLLTIVCVAIIIPPEEAWARLSCMACGADCAATCGSDRFRACCFNYNKRSDARTSSSSSYGRSDGGIRNDDRKFLMYSDVTPETDRGGSILDRIFYSFPGRQRDRFQSAKSFDDKSSRFDRFEYIYKRD
ncbi:Uncharacterised protein g4354 [Pycnogonum litorale]